MKKVKYISIIAFLLLIFISAKKTEAKVLDESEETAIVQWEDKNFGESICNVFGKKEVTYADIKEITGISIDSQYVVTLYWENTTKQYVFDSGNDMCVMLEPQEFTTLNDLKKFPALRELKLNECIIDNNAALGELSELETLQLDGYVIESPDILKKLTELEMEEKNEKD